MARTVFMEQRSKFGPSIDLQPAAPQPPAASLAAALAAPGEFAVAVRGGRTYSLRLAQGAAPRQRAAVAVRSALVTGGSKVSKAERQCRNCSRPNHNPPIRGPTLHPCCPFLQGLGLEYCRSLVQRGCRLLVVASRSGALPANALAELATAGCTVLAVRADSADAATVARVLAWAREELPHLEHFAHASGVTGTALLQDMSPQDVHAVADVKVGWCRDHLHVVDQRTSHMLPHTAASLLPVMMQTAAAAAFPQAALPLGSQLLFSSISAVWSQSGSAHYAAANAYLDAHAAASQAAGLPATAVQFGPFAGAGMAAAHVEGLAALGLKSLDPRQVGVCTG